MRKTLKIISVIIISLVFLGLLVFIIKYSMSEKKELTSTLISNISTYLMAFFTISYVLINNAQLSQQKRDFTFSNKPLPYINSISFFIQNPKLWINPKNGKTVYFALYDLVMNIKNIGADPAISVDIKATIDIINKKTIETEIKSISNFEGKIEAGEEKEIVFSFPLDLSNSVIEILSKSNTKLVILEVLLLFRNYIGNAFETKYYFILNTDSNNIDIINSLYDEIVEKREKYRKEMEGIDEKIGRREEYNTDMDKLKYLIDSKDSRYQIELVEVPIEKSIVQLSYEKYKEIRDTFSHQKIVQGKSNGCGSALLETDTKKKKIKI